MRKQKTMFDNYTYLNVRIMFLLSALAHLAVTAVATLSVDTAVDDDPKLKAYYYTRWKLLSCWVNLITLAYLSVRLYSDWQTKQGAGNSTLVTILYQASDMVMTGLLFPITLYGDIMFWSLFWWDRALMTPLRLWEYLPTWGQHSLHTVSSLVVLADLRLTPRRLPASLRPRIALLLSFIFVYIWVVYQSYLEGEVVYPLLEDMSSVQLLATAVFSIGFIVMLFAIQWKLIDLFWGTKPKRKIT